MSTEAVKSKVKQLLSTSTPEVIALKGRWGVGKTFFWNRLIKSLAMEKSLALPKYAYVSLFGIGSLDQLKSALFEHTVQRENIADGVSVTTVGRNLRNFFSLWGEETIPKPSGIVNLGKSLIRRGASIAGSIPQVQGYAALLRSGAFLLVRDTLICIDDLERKGTGLDVRDVMGLISFLKEQRNCKVALIFNEGSLEAAASTQYSSYREKVVDVELEYAPSIRETVTLVFDERSPYYSEILKRAELLKLTNIRVLQKIKRTLDDLEPICKGLVAASKENVLSGAILLSWAYFSRETGGPTLDYIKSLDAGFMWGAEMKKKKTIFQQADEKAEPTESQQRQHVEDERNEKWNEQLRSYGWQFTDDLDRLLARHIERGFPDEELAEALTKKDEEYRGGNAQHAIEKAWQRFNESFDDNGEELANTLIETVRQNVRYMGRDQLNSIVSLLRTLEKDEQANSLGDLFVQINMDRPEMFSTEGFFGGDSAIDPYLADKFFHARGLSEKAPQIKDVVHRIAENSGWNPTDEQFLVSLSEDDIYAFLKSQRTMHLHPYIRALLRFGEFGNSTEQQKSIANTTKAVLKRIAAESLLNGVRSRRYQLNS